MPGEGGAEVLRPGGGLRGAAVLQPVFPGEVKIVTESPGFAQRLPGLFRRAFGIEFDEKGDPATPGKRIFSITDPQKLSLLWELCAFDPSGPAHHINFGMLEETHCRLAFLRGPFWRAGR